MELAAPILRIEGVRAGTSESALETSSKTPSDRDPGLRQLRACSSSSDDEDKKDSDHDYEPTSPARRTPTPRHRTSASASPAKTFASQADIRVAGDVIHVAGQVICVSGIRVQAYAYSYAGTQQQRRRTSQRPGFYGNGKQLQETPRSRG